MHQEYPKLMYGRGASTRVVGDREAESAAEAAGFTTTPGDAHRIPHRTAGPAAPVVPEPLTEAHIPLIVEHVARALGAAPELPADGVELLTVDHIGTVVETLFDRLRDMAVAASHEPGARAASDAVVALHESLEERFAALRSGLVDEIRALIAPAPTAKSGKA